MRQFPAILFAYEKPVSRTGFDLIYLVNILHIDG